MNHVQPIAFQLHDASHAERFHPLASHARTLPTLQMGDASAWRACAVRSVCDRVRVIDGQTDDGVVDKYHVPLLTPRETARHLQLPGSTLNFWLREQAAGEPLVHRVPPAKRGWPSVPFVAVIEAYVLRSLRDLKLPKGRIRDAAAAVRREFGTPYGLATRRIATDGIDIFVDYANGSLERAHDAQRPIREVIDRYLRYITWDEGDDSPARLTLPQYPDVAPVVIDPRFGWGAPVIAKNKVQVDNVVALWRAGESLEAVAEEYGLTRDAAEAICRIAA